MGKEYIFDWRWELKSTPEQLWDYVGDTNRLNIVTGMPKLAFREVPQPDGGVKRYAHAPIYRWLSLDWEEMPFDWVRPLRHSVKRVFNSRLFPIKSLQNVFNLKPLPTGGTELQFKLTLESNSWWGRFFIPGIAKSTHASFEKAFQKMDAFIQGIEARPFETPLVTIEGEGKAQLATLIGQLETHPKVLVEKFHAHLLEAPAESLTRMRPYAFAKQWDTDRYETLALFLHAASIGILDLSWDILCPECRGDKGKVRSLYDLPDTVHCPSCNIDYSLDFEKSVEATFSLNSSIAPVYRTDYCIGGPHATPHVLVQQVLAPQEQRTATFPIPLGYYRFRAPRLGGTEVRSPAAILVPLEGQPWLTAIEDNAPNTLLLTLEGQEVELSTPTLQAGNIQITMHNQTNHEQVLICEDGEWSTQLATAADVTAMQEFRRLFSSESLRPGYTIAIQSMVVLFSDLKDSTALYQRLGDASAFGTVIDHFTILREVIANHHGAVVKTIGDAIMAVFRNAGDAFLAGLDMQRRIQVYNESNTKQRLVLKMGLHQGPCIAVNLNDRLDYFGSTVNLAARLEGKSTGGDIVISHDFINLAPIRAILEQESLSVESFTANLKGLEGNYNLYRISPFNYEARTEEMWVDVAE